MKTISNNIILVGAICIFSMSLSSCFTIGAALFAGDGGGSSTFSENKEQIFEGWHKPEHKNVLIKLNLSNKVELTGKYKGEDIFKTGKETYQFALVKTHDKIEKVPLKYITQTEYLKPQKKIGKGAAVLIGFGIDVALTAIALSTSEGDGWFEFDLWGSN